MRAHGHGNSLDSFHDCTQYNADADADAWAIITATIKYHTLSLTPAEIWQNVLNALVLLFSSRCFVHNYTIIISFTDKLITNHQHRQPIMANVANDDKPIQ